VARGRCGHADLRARAARVQPLDAGDTGKKLIKGLAHAELGKSLLGDDIYECKNCEANPFRYEQLGHDAPPTGIWDSNLITDEPLTLCPVRALQFAPKELQREILRWKEDYRVFKQGQLLVPGGISAQPARWLEAMLLLQSMESKQELKYLKLKTPDGDS
jgi:hypothetical protein